MLVEATFSLFMAMQPDMALLRQVFEQHVTRCEQDYGPGDPRTAAAERDLAFFLRDSGDNAGAAAAFSKALKIDQAHFGAEAPRALAGIIALASVSEPREAEALLRRALASRGMNAALAVPALSTLGDLRFAAKDRGDAAACWRKALQVAEQSQGADSLGVEKILNSLAAAVEPKESIALLARAYGIAKGQLGAAHPETASCALNLAHALLKAERAGDAAEKAREALSGLETSLGPRHPRVAAALSLLAETLRAQGRAAEAEPLELRAREIERLNASKP